MPARKSAFKPTEEQIACVQAAKLFQDLRIEAFAGATNTTTLRLIAEALAPKKGLYLAFNKGVVEAAKFPSNVTAKTVHSVAYAHSGRPFGRRLDTRLTGSLVAQALGLSEFSGNGKLIMSAADLGAHLLATIDAFCCDMEPVITLEHMPLPDLRSTEIPPGMIRQFLWDNYKNHIHRLWTMMSDPDGEMPTRHGVYLKLWALSSPAIKADFVLLDEGQDADPLMLAVLSNQKIPVIVVGDRYQAIYGWRGAVNAMSNFKASRVAHLTQSFRFGRELASAADMLLCAMGADTSLRGNDAVTTVLEELDKPSAILCRTNANVSKWVMEAVKSGDTDFAATGMQDALEFFESAVALKKGRCGKGKYRLFGNWGEMMAYAKTDDGSDLANYVWLEREHGAEATLQVLKKVASKKPGKVKRVISTAHRAKGLEFETVLLDDDFRGPSHPKYRPEDARLLYVAMTRAQHGLDMSRADDAFMELVSSGVCDESQAVNGAMVPAAQSRLPELVLGAPMIATGVVTARRSGGAKKSWGRRRVSRTSRSGGRRVAVRG